MRADVDSRLADEFARSFLSRYRPQRLSLEQMELPVSHQLNARKPSIRAIPFQRRGRPSGRLQKSNRNGLSIRCSMKFTAPRLRCVRIQVQTAMSQTQVLWAPTSSKSGWRRGWMRESAVCRPGLVRPPDGIEQGTETAADTGNLHAPRSDPRFDASGHPFLTAQSAV